MPTKKYFAQCPDFPPDVPILDVPTISLKLLQEHNRDESKRLFQACKDYGFFMLNLEGIQSGTELLHDAEAMYDLTNETMDLGKDVLKDFAYQPPKTLNGYKTSGLLKTDDGKLDAMEMFTIGQDHVLGLTERQPLPAPIQSRWNQCRDFCLHAHETLCTITDSLDQQLDLPIGTIRSLCPPNKSSETGFRLLRAYPGALAEDQSITLGGHTDIGTIAILFHVVGGLQILPAGGNLKQDWRYIRPRQGCALVNIGDTLVEWTGGVLKSSLHRVHNPPGEQAKMVRQSLAYLIRPARSGTMRRLQIGSVIPALAKEDKDEVRGVDEWAAWRTLEIIKGRLKPETRGGTILTIDGTA